MLFIAQPLARLFQQSETWDAPSPEFVTYCEAHPNWQPHFTWENYGKVWHVDHIKALGLFDLTDPEQQRLAVHYTNLQSLSTELHILKTIEDTRRIRESRSI